MGGRRWTSSRRRHEPRIVGEFRDGRLRASLMRGARPRIGGLAQYSAARRSASARRRHATGAGSALFASDALAAAIELGERVEGGESFGVRRAFRQHRLEELGLELAQHLLEQVGHRRSPTVGADHRREPRLGGQRVGEDRGVSKARMRSGQHRRAGEHDRRGVDQRHRQHAGVETDRVEQPHRQAFLHQSVGQPFHHRRGAVVHRHVDDHDLRLDVVRRPAAVKVQDQLRLGVHRPVAGRDDFRLERLHPLERAAALDAVGRHDLGVVALGCYFELGFVADGELGRREVRAEEIAREEDAVFFEEDAHRLRPMHPRHENEFQRLAAERKLAPVLRLEERAAVERHLVAHHPPATRIGDDLGLGEEFEHRWYRASVIELGVVGDDIVDRLDAGRLQGGDELRGLGRVDGVDQGGLLAALDQIGIVAGAVGQRNQLVEQLAVPVVGAQRIDVVFDLHRDHGRRISNVGTRFAGKRTGRQESPTHKNLPLALRGRRWIPWRAARFPQPSQLASAFLAALLSAGRQPSRPEGASFRALGDGSRRRRGSAPLRADPGLGGSTWISLPHWRSASAFSVA